MSTGTLLGNGSCASSAGQQQGSSPWGPHERWELLLQLGLWEREREGQAQAQWLLCWL